MANRVLWTGGRIFTSAEPAWAEALVVDGDRLAFVGSASEAARVAGAGAEVVMPVGDQFWGDRYGQVRDPFGHLWSIGCPIGK